MFSHYLIVSPSLWWDNESLLDQAKTLLDQQSGSRAYAYVSVGDQEPKIMQKDARKLASVLKAAKHLKLTVDFVPLAHENHATILHQSINEALKRLFPYQG